MKRRYLLLLAISLLASCKESYSVFSNKYPVSFSCDTSVTPFNSTSTYGYFLSIRPKATKDGYKVKRPDGTEHEYPYTEMQSRVFSFGLAGLVIGRPYFGEGEIYAYDLGCPHCDKSSVRLNVNADGIASCARCSGTYDLNNGGMPQTVSKKPLYRYRTTLNGSMLVVHN